MWTVCCRDRPMAVLQSCELMPMRRGLYMRIQRSAVSGFLIVPRVFCAAPADAFRRSPLRSARCLRCQFVSSSSALTFGNRVLYVERSFREANWPTGLGHFGCIVTNQAVHELRHKRHNVALTWPSGTSSARVAFTWSAITTVVLAVWVGSTSNAARLPAK